MRNIATFLAIVLGLCALPLFTLWAVSNIRYIVGRTSLRITWFGFTARKILFTQIKRVSKRAPTRPAKYWVNVPKLSHRVVTVYLHTGKPIVVTPANRYVFIADLKKAIQAAIPKDTDKSSDQLMPEFDEGDPSQLSSED